MAARYALSLLVTLCWLLGSGAERPARPIGAPSDPMPHDIRLPLSPQSVRFAIIGDNGNASPEQYDVARQMARYREKVGFDFVLMLGDNIYGGKRPLDFKRKFEDPYQPLLSAGVQFFASLGNHDDPNERFYKPFNMNGQRYYSFRRGDATFLALDSTYMDSGQLDWIEKQLAAAKTSWKICFFHHPLYSDGSHGPDLDLRARLEPLFQRYTVKIVLAGHEHVYERIAPQGGVYYFVLGNSGELRRHDLKKSAQTMKGFDTDRGFGLFEINSAGVYYQVVSRLGETIDGGTIPAVK